MLCSDGVHWQPMSICASSSDIPKQLLLPIVQAYPPKANFMDSKRFPMLVPAYINDGHGLIQVIPSHANSQCP